MVTRCLGCMEEYDNTYGLCPHCGFEPDTSVDSPIHMQPGVILHGRYLIGKVLSFGGFGVTYIGWDFTLQQKVAIKEYLPSEFATRLVGQTRVSVFGGKKEEQFGDGMNQFVEEAKRLAQFQNEEGVVRIYDSFAENNTAYIIMEYLDGETLTAYLDRNGKIPMDDAVKMLTPVLNSLEVIHNAGIIHRDIAPDNIFLTKDGSGEAEPASCTIEVRDYEMTLSETTLPLFAGGSSPLTIIGIPNYGEITWSTSDAEIATVNENGIVTGVGDGSATITATWVYDGRTYTATAEAVVEAKGITLNVTKISSFYTGETRTIECYRCGRRYSRHYRQL